MRYRNSGSAKASCTFPSSSTFTAGRGFNDFESTVNSLTITLCSPVWVVKVSPEMPMKSPRSRSFLKTVLYIVLSSSGHNSSRLRYNWKVPSLSWISANEALPMMRRLMMRPARVTAMPSLNSAANRFERWVTVNSAAGYGSIPWARKAAKDSRRMRSCSVRCMA